MKIAKKHLKLVVFLLWSLSLFLTPEANAQTLDAIAQKRLEAQRKTDSLWALKAEALQSGMMLQSEGLITPQAAIGSIEVHEDATYATYTPKQLVENIFLKGGGCASVSNITYKGHGWDGSGWTHAENRGLGYFRKGTSNFEMAEGLVLSTGGLHSIAGPNTGANNVAGPSDGKLNDSDLSGLLDGISGSVTNVSVLEFDFVPTGNTVQFRYVFSSEEYANYVNTQYNDVFGFFISGPGVTGGKQNIALLPTTTTGSKVVSINNVNDGKRSYANHNCPPGSGVSNSAYYVNIPGSFSNCKALTAAEQTLQKSMQLNGRTVVLTATYTVQPCQTYHLKFAVGNVGDQAYQSAVFLEARSFDAGDEMVNFGNGIEGMDYLYRGCTNNKLRVTRPTPDPFPIQVSLKYEGTAVRGTDIIGPNSGGAFPTLVTIPAGQSYVDIPYSVPTGPTGYKYMEVTILCPCDNSSLKKKLHIYDRSPDNIFQVSSTPSCPGVNSGRINANIASGGSGHYETSLNGGPWQLSTLGYANLAPGTYTVKMRDEGSCYSVTRTVTVGQASVNPGANQSSCGNTFTMDAPPLNSGESGKWTVVSGAATITYPTNPKSPVTVTTSPAKLRWTLNTGVCTVAGDVTLTVYPKPTVGTISGPNSVCAGSKINLTNSTTGGTWTSSNTAIATVNSTTGEVTGVAAGSATITYTVKNSNNCTNSATKSITVNAQPTVNPITGPGEVCVNGTITLATTTTGGSWSSSNTAIATVNTSGVVTGKAAGTVTITYTKTASGCTGTASKTITVNALPTVGDITGDAEVCVNKTITLSSTPSGGTWTSSNTAVATITSAGVVTGKTAGTTTITYTVTNAKGCVQSKTKTITVNALPTVGDITGDAEVCVNKTITLSSTPSGGTWTSSNTAVATITSAGVVTGKTAGTTIITYTVTNAKGCVQSKTKTITVNALPTVGDITGDAEVCVNKTITLSSTPSGGTWTSSNTAVATITGAGVVTGKTAGTTTITYTVTNAKGCVQSKTKTITVNALPTVGDITGDAEVCVNKTITLSSTPSGGTWTSSNTAVATITGAGVVTGKTAGTTTITYTVTNAKGCVQSKTKTITVNALPTVSPITGPTPKTVCVNGTLQLNNATTGGSWSSGNTSIATISSSGLVTGKSAGTVTITYTVTNSTTGCSQSVTTEVTVMSNPMLTISAASVDEGGMLVFTVTRVGDACSPGNYTVRYQTVDGTATAPADYVATSGTLTFSASELTKTISVQTNPDDIIEGSETMTLRLYDPVNCALTGGGTSLNATGTIVDRTDGTVIVEKYAPLPVSTPASEPSTHGSFRVRFANSNVTCVKDVKVDYALNGANLGNDYTVDTSSPHITSTTATIPSGQKHIDIPIKVVNNFVVEGTRTLEVTISNAIQLP